MTKQERHELRMKIARQLKQTQALLTFVKDEDLVSLENKLQEILKSLSE